MTVASLMNSNVLTVAPETVLPQAVRLLTHYDIGALPVVQADGLLRGIVTDRDMLTRSVALESELGMLTVGEVMTRAVVSIPPDADVREAAAVMGVHRVRRLPVTKHGRLVGVITLADLARAKSCDAEASLALGKISRPR
ncbi:MAG: CBS domain-containing protein [Clostridia bacterium]|nr:CBS domain-containing protein [Clostridia bacterium]